MKSIRERNACFHKNPETAQPKRKWVLENHDGNGNWNLNKQRVSWAQQWLCTCVIHLCRFIYFLCKTTTWNNQTFSMYWIIIIIFPYKCRICHFRGATNKNSCRSAHTFDARFTFASAACFMKNAHNSPVWYPVYTKKLFMAGFETVSVKWKLSTVSHEICNVASIIRSIPWFSLI